jgi:hypothetical protein
MIYFGRIVITMQATMHEVEFKKELKEKLAALQKEHSELDYYVANIANIDQFTAQKMKKRKLFLKDQIKSLKAIIEPNIIA